MVMIFEGGVQTLECLQNCAVVMFGSLGGGGFKHTNRGIQT